MLRHASAVALVALSTALALPACSSDEPEAPALELQPTTKVLDADALGRISDASEDAAKITFGSTSAAVDAVVVGDVVLGGIGPKTPYGILRRVTAVEKTGAGPTWTTTTASLTDAIKRGHIKMPRRALTGAGTRTKVGEGVHATLPTTGGLAGQSLGLRDVDGIPEGSVNQDFTLGIDRWKVANGIEASGSIGFGLGADLDIDVSPTNASGTLTLTGSESATLDLFAEYGRDFGKDRDLVTYYFPPIPIVIAGVEMVIVLQLDVTAGVHGYTHSALAWSSKEDASVDVGVKVSVADGVTPVTGGGASGSADPPLVEGSLLVKGTVGFKLSASLNAGFASVALWTGADGFVSLDANSANDPCWTLDYGLDGRVGAAAYLISDLIKVAGTEVKPPIAKGNITKGSCGPDTRPVTPWSTVLAPTSFDELKSAALLPDQSFLLSARTAGSSSYAARLKKDGASIWERKYGGLTDVTDVVADPDNSTWLGGRIGTASSFARVDDDGVPLFAKSFATPDGAEGLSDVFFAPSRSGGLLIGSTYGITGGGMVAKVDANGVLQWANVYPTFGSAYAIAEGSDGGALLFGTVTIAGGAKSSVLKTTPAGAVSFVKSFGEGRFFAGARLEKGGLIATGANAGGNQATVVRIADDGTMAWGFQYGPDGSDTTIYASAAVAERNDGFLVAGKHGFGGGADGWAMLVSPDGSLGWSRGYASAGQDYFSRVVVTPDNGAILGGTTYGFGETRHVLLARVPPLGALDFTNPGATQANLNGIKDALPGTETTLAPTVTPIALVVKDADVAPWTGEPITAPRTKLAH